jgi:SAM-dependent methyltransferase
MDESAGASPVSKAPRDGSAGDANYAIIGDSYSAYRQPEPAIEAAILAALGDARTVINVGAGTGSYEPASKRVTPIEPSASMRAQRPAERAPALDAVAEKLPFPDQHFDAAMAISTVHQWADLHAGLSEMRRVAKGPVVILTSDPLLIERFWLNDYAPEVLRTEARRFPGIDAITIALAGSSKVTAVMIPLNCKDGFNEAYYGRPERLLKDEARLACSSWSFIDRTLTQRYIQHLAGDLHNGGWDAVFGELRKLPEYDGSLRLIVASP